MTAAQDQPADQHEEPDRSDNIEPDQGAQDKAAEMMTAYEDRPTLVLPGSGKTITGTAVNDWLDENGDPKAAGDRDAPAAKAKDVATTGKADGTGEWSAEENYAKDKAYNERVLKDAAS